MSSPKQPALSYHRRAGHLRGATGEEEYLVTVPVRSAVSFSQCGKDVRCPPGGFILERRHEPCDFAHAEAADLWVLKVGAGLLSGRLRAPDRFCSVAFDAGRGAGGLLADLLPLLPRRIDSLGADGRAAVGRQLVDLIGLAVSEDPRTLTSALSSVRMAHLARIEALVRRGLADSGLGAGSVAAAAGISERYLHALFRDAGQSFGQWVRAQRLEAARAALADPGSRQSIAAIADGCGFSDQSQFNRSFRGAFGVSPSDCRARRRLTPLRPQARWARIFSTTAARSWRAASAPAMSVSTKRTGMCGWSWPIRSMSAEITVPTIM
jgi:AraC-like DNA-binding protein